MPAICCIIGALITIWTNNPKYIRLTLHIFVIVCTQSVMCISIIWVQLQNNNRNLGIGFDCFTSNCNCISKIFNLQKSKSVKTSQNSPNVDISYNNCFDRCCKSQNIQDCLKIVCCCIGIESGF